MMSSCSGPSCRAIGQRRWPQCQSSPGANTKGWMVMEGLQGSTQASRRPASHTRPAVLPLQGARNNDGGVSGRTAACGSMHAAGRMQASSYATVCCCCLCAHFDPLNLSGALCLHLSLDAGLWPASAGTHPNVRLAAAGCARLASGQGTDGAAQASPPTHLFSPMISRKKPTSFIVVCHRATHPAGSLQR